MMYLELSIITISFLISLVSTLPHILQFQIAEYLLYRYNSMMLDSSVMHMLFPGLRMPAKSMRNLLIFGIVGIVLLSSTIWIYMYTDDLSITLVLSVTQFFFAKFAVMLGVILTSPIAWALRYRRILIAKRQINNSKVKVIGITGSYGKSSVKEILHRLLSVKYLTTKTRANHNTDVGIAIEAGLQITPYTEYFIAEMGAYREGDIKKLCKRYQPEIGVVTSIGNQHVSLFGSLEKIKETKLEMVNGTLNGPVYINIDWEGGYEYLKKYGYLSKNVITYGLSSKADARVVNIRSEKGITRFYIIHKERNQEYAIKLLGRHNVMNAVPGILIAQSLGISDQHITDVLMDIEPVLGKLSVHKGINGLMILNDGYNSNINGFIAALDVLADIGKKNMYVSTLGLFELGKEKVEAYRTIVEKAQKVSVRILTTDKDLNIKGFENSVTLCESEKGILDYLKKLEGKDNVLLLEGRHSLGFTNSLGITKVY